MGCTSQVQMAFKSKFVAGRRCLPAVVRLHSGSPDQNIGLLSQCLGQEEFVVPGLVAAKEQTGAIVALDENSRSFQALGKAACFFQRGRQMGQRNSWQPSGYPPQIVNR